MRTFPFALVDAFTTKPLSGNPCAIVMNADHLSDAEMLAIAKEMNQAETAFLSASKVANLKARYFTPACEIPLAGHPTIASIHIALETGLIKFAPEISLELKDGPIKVAIEKTSSGHLIKMFQRKPQFFETHDPNVVLPMFGLSLDDLLPSAVIQTVSTGTKQMMVPVKSHDSLKKLSMNVDAFRAYHKKLDFFGPHFFCLQGATADGNTFARHLGVPPDLLEDAFTGSATGNMAAYLFRNRLIGSRFVAEQGHWMGRPGQAFVEVVGVSEEIETVVVAGNAVTVVAGEMKV